MITTSTMSANYTKWLQLTCDLINIDTFATSGRETQVVHGPQNNTKSRGTCENQKIVQHVFGPLKEFLELSCAKRYSRDLHLYGPCHFRTS